MHVRERLGTKLVIGCMAAATALTALPKAQGQDKPKAAATEGTETKAPKKTKKKRSIGTHKMSINVGWHNAPLAMKRWVRPAARTSPVELVNIVLAVARKQLGKPYHYGSTGPSTFDCSGLTRFVYAAAGVHLPHNSGAQYAATKHVPLDKMKPGDLVFFPHHVGLYIGHGQMIHAPQSGERVRVAPLQGNLYGAGRPLGA